MDRRDLEYFAITAERGSLSGASQKLDLTPAALSKSLKRLEASVGAKLMERGPKGMRVTGAGRVLLSRLEALRVMLDDVRREAAELGAGKSGALRVGISEVDSEMMATVCARLVQEAPMVQLAVLASNNDVMVPELRKGALDLIFNILPAVPFEGTEQIPVFDDAWVICASARHPLARKRNVTIADVARQPWVYQPPDVLSRRATEQAFEKAGFPPPRSMLEARSAPLRLGMLAQTNALGTVSRRTLRNMAVGATLVELKVKELFWPITVGVIRRKDAYLPRSGVRLIELLQSAARERR